MYRHTYRLIYPSAFIAGKLGLEEPGGCSKTFKYSYQGSCGWGVGGGGVDANEGLLHPRCLFPPLLPDRLNDPSPLATAPVHVNHNSHEHN